MTIAERNTTLKFFAEREGLTLSELAEIAGVSNRTFAKRLETFNFKVNESAELAKALKLDNRSYMLLFYKQTYKRQTTSPLSGC